MTPDRLRAAYETARADLLAEQSAAGHWIGRLSDSALSTATAVSALSVVRRQGSGDRLGEKIDRGIAWLSTQQNADGGWGDTDRSLSNIATTMLVQAAFHLAGAAERHRAMLSKAAEYVAAQGGIGGLRRRYGKDNTFAAPILANAAIAGLVPWKDVPALPFEVAGFSHETLGRLGIPVVSYAIPALVAIGQARFLHRKPWNPLTRWLRGRSVEKTLAVASRMQPDSGGFLEAAPLTSFVVMSLADTGRAGHPIVARGVEFLERSMRDNGAWPIDTDLATWVTTLSIGALGPGKETLAALRWLLQCQNIAVHPYTGAEPGGWGWTDKSGAVPDADDTSGAILALATLLPRIKGAELIVNARLAAAMGLYWLLTLQNRDGGWPTFCRGWGTLPFDRSGVDLTAHVLRAIEGWRRVSPRWIEEMLRGLQQIEGGEPFKDAPSPEQTAKMFQTAVDRGFAFLSKQQRRDGSWIPLWFGNQHHPNEENPVYGTGRALLAYRDYGRMNDPAARRGVAWLAAAQRPDGGWGGGLDQGEGNAAALSSLEETAVAVEALLAAEPDAQVQAVVEKGLSFLVAAVEAGGHRRAEPIGLYFAKLWYYERLYPLIFTVSALRQGLAARET